MISEIIDEIYDAIEEEGYNPESVLNSQGIDDDEDLIAFALRFLMSNMEEAIIEPFLDELEESGPVEEEFENWESG